MRIFFVLLFLSAIVLNDLMMDMVKFQDAPIENQSEKESQDGTEDEFKIEYLSDNYFDTDLKWVKPQLSATFISLFILTAYKEIHIPPPEWPSLRPSFYYFTIF